MTSRAMGAAKLPCMPPSNRTETTISGSSRGAKPTNQALSLHGLRRVPCSPWRSRSTARWELPVLPQICEAGQTRASRGAALVHDAVHPIHDLGVHRIDVDDLFAGALRREILDEVRRCIQTPPVAMPPMAWASWMGVMVKCALADGDGDGLAGVPFLAEVADLPLAGGHDAFLLLRQVDAGLASQAAISAYLAMLSMPSLLPSV